MGRLNSNTVRKCKARAEGDQRPTFSVIERDVGRARVPTPALADSPSLWPTRIRIYELLVAQGLLPLDRMMGGFDIHRIIRIHALVIPELGAVLSCPRGLREPGGFNSRSTEQAEGKGRHTASLGLLQPPSSTPVMTTINALNVALVPWVVLRPSMWG